MNRPIKRRAEVVGIFPNDQAVIRRAGAILMERSDERAVQCRSMALEPLAARSDERTRLPEIAVA